jgi:thioredoxin 1
MAAEQLKLESTDFEANVLKSNVPVLVDFWAAWCRPCLAIGPSVEEVAKEFEGRAKVYKVDVDSNSELASEYGVMSIPALLVFKDGKVFDQMIGAGPKQAISGLLERALTA